MRYLAGSWQTPANKEINSSTAIEGKLIILETSVRKILITTKYPGVVQVNHNHDCSRRLPALW